MAIKRGGRGPFHENRASGQPGGGPTGPSQFTFTDVTNVTVASTQTSNTITLAGSGGPYSVSVSGDATSQFSKNGGAYTSTGTTAAIGDTFAVRHTSSASNLTTVNTTLTVGTTSDTYSSTTVAAGASSFLLMEDGTSDFLLEDGTSKVLLEA